MFAVKPKPQKKTAIRTLQGLKDLANKMKNISEFSYDTETNTLEVNGPNSNLIVVGISITFSQFDNYYIPFGHRRIEDQNRQLSLDTVLKYLKPIFEREDVTIIGQNLKFDMHVLARIGIELKTTELIDTMILSWLCDENTLNGLKENTKAKLGIDQGKFKDVTALVPKEIKKAFGLKGTSKATFDLTLIEDAYTYAIDDSYYTWELYKGFLSLATQEEMLGIYNKLYKYLIPTIFKMEERGILVDKEQLDLMEVEITKDLEDLHYKIVEGVGVMFNPGSSTQLAELLYGYEKPGTPLNPQSKSYAKDIIKYPDGIKPANINKELVAVNFGFKITGYTDGGAPATGKEALWEIHKTIYNTTKQKKAQSIVRLIMEYKKLSKINSAFVGGLRKKLYEDGKAHPNYGIVGTDSGRFSCSSPNLQQLPNAHDEDKYQIRSLFVTESTDNKLIALDYSNLEMRVLAHFSQDDKLVPMFEQNEDAHGSTAVTMFELPCEVSEAKTQYADLRQASKTINFLLMYGGGAGALYDSLRLNQYSPIDLGASDYLKKYKCRTGAEVAQKYIDIYFSKYVGVANFIKNQKRNAKQHGFVYSLLRRKRRLRGINSTDRGVAGYNERLSVNAPIQGSASDIIMSAQVRINKDKWFEEHNVKMLLQVHDELVIDCPEKHLDEAIKKLKHYMEHPFGDDVKLNIPLDVSYDTGHSYQEAK